MIHKLKDYAAAPFRRVLRNAVRNELLARAQDLDYEFQLRARQTSADYIAQNLVGARVVNDRLALLDLGVDAILDKSGVVLEFGVYRGESIRHLARRFRGSVFGFDSFDGLPEFWRPGYDKGAFKLKALPRVPPNVTLIKGWFSDTLPQFVRENTGSIALLHIDCDLYSSTVTIFDALHNRLPPGAVIVFDEYFNYPDWQNGEFKAFREYCVKFNRKYKYIGYNAAHEQVAVVMG